MQSNLGHVQLNVPTHHFGFYKELLTFLGWEVIFDSEGAFGIADSKGFSLWFIGEVKDVAYDYDGPGLNHLGIVVGAQADVDAAADYLVKHGVQHLFDTPRHRPDFSGDGPNTYYQVMFESPDRILFEIVYTGPKSV
jgi:catechol 2,3-dioxygenase-like lactoylglutathione lyase family enzyme